MTGAGNGLIPTIVRKELRENFKWALLGLLLFSAFLISDLQTMTRSEFPADTHLTSLFTTMAILTAVIGLAIGLTQVLPENRGDKWSFLTHRPASRSTLFWGKALAGILLYTTAVTIPWAAAMFWIATPGHVSIPFDPRMLLPGTADLLCGIVYYFAGLLTGMRVARWYGSRTMGIGIGVICSFGCQNAVTLEWALVFVAGGLLIIIPAAWGAFLGGGHDETQPRITRVATGVAIGCGILMSCFAAIVVLIYVTHDTRARYTSIQYSVDSDGSIVRMVSENGLRVGIQDQLGRPIEKYNNPEIRDTSNRGVLGRTMALDRRGSRGAAYNFRWPGQYFVSFYPNEFDDTYGYLQWYYVVREHLIAAYDSKTARLVGWIGPDGFSAGPVPPDRRFEGPLLNRNSPFQPLLAFRDAVYRVDLARRRIEKIFSPISGEAVIGAEGPPSFESTSYVSGSGADFGTIATTRRFIVQASNGTVEITTSLDPQAIVYGRILVYRAMYAPGTPTFIWRDLQQENRPENAFHEVERFEAGSTAVARVSLPRLTSSSSLPWNAVPFFLTIPVTVRSILAKAWRLGDSTLDLSSEMSQGQRTVAWILSGFASLASAAAIHARSRRYAFSKGRKWTWTILGFLLGPFSLLLMLVSHEWPALEKCPACGRPRVVTHEHCEHCSKAFLVPPADGTEVFEPI